jgi:hypothetical protein
MEADDPTVSIDLSVKALLELAVSLSELARMIVSTAPVPR